MPFATVAVPFDAYASLPTPQHRWVLMALARYADREGRCWPSMRQLARDARMSLASVCRYLQSMADLGVFHRTRRSGGRYSYVLAEAYVPRWPGRVSSPQPRVPQTEKQQAHPQSSQYNQDFQDDSARWKARLRGWERIGAWPVFAGPRPDEPGCWAPRDMIDAVIKAGAS